MVRNFAVTGVGGYVAPRHLRAIGETGHRVVAALDPHDSVGHLDEYSYDVRFFTETERFDRHLERLRRGPDAARIHYLSVCSPNHLHDAHCRMGLRVGADVVCEKPVVINPWNLDALAELEAETSRRIWSVLQLRVHPKLVALKAALDAGATRQGVHDVELTYVTARGPWYDVSWKGIPERSGGIAMAIGIHFFDLLGWLFGAAVDSRVHLSTARRMAGFLAFERANVRFFLSLEHKDLPEVEGSGPKGTYRSIRIDGTDVDFTDGFDELHTRVYEEILAGRGHGIEDARPAIELVHALRNAGVERGEGDRHPSFAHAPGA
ncbi:MAG: Gfo/Idh/MocA family oxidoreductase [Polyangiaceae bacterium]